MTQTDRKLLRDITIVVVLKLIALTALWFAFVRDQKVSVDAERAAAVVTSTTPSVRASQGEVHAQ